MKQLELLCIDDVQPLLGLTRLQELRVTFQVGPEQLHQLAAAIGASLTSVVLWQPPIETAHALLSERFSSASALPLNTLCVGRRANAAGEPPMMLSISHLWQWPTLQHLALDCVSIDSTPAQLASQLRQLTCLSSLQLSADVGGSHAAPVLQPVVGCIVGLSSLQELFMCQQQLTAEQRSMLTVLTHLTELHL